MSRKTAIPETSSEFDHANIIERPDGFYWQDTETGKTYGPFRNMSDAMADMEFNADSEVEASDSLEEAEAELGVLDGVEELADLDEDFLYNNR